MNDPIKVKKDGPVLEVTIDRPKANAIDSKTSIILGDIFLSCLLYTSPSPRDATLSRMPSSA